MQRRTNAAKWMDRIFGVLILLSVSFLWFAVRLERLIPAALLALVFTALSLYGFSLLSRHLSGRKTQREVHCRKRQAALYALTMLPYDEALDYAVQALMEAYPLKRLYTVDHIQFLSDMQQRRIAVQVSQSPQYAAVSEVHAFHKLRRNAYAVMVCAGGVSKEAGAYAQSLTPPLRLIPAQELPLPEGLYGSPPAQAAQKRRTASSILALMLRPAQALRYMMLSFLLIVAYILTDQLTCLIPALILIFLALISKRRSPSRNDLF